ncbi:MAG: hypothetical protein GF353_24315, partial [Candidatus Lokiarchaeota archaeon]|nr:hypothetical protein [Candidatus Lokiarchaeota archaeon]
MNKKKIIALIFGVFFIGLGTYGFYFLYRQNKPEIIKDFPNPFKFNNGTKVETKEEWDLRREEIKETLLSKEYGHMPGRPDALRAEVEDSDKFNDGSILNIVKLTIIPSNVTPDTNIEFTVWVYIPDEEGPLPAIVKVSPDGTGTQDKISDKVLERGYIFACFEHTELDPDTRGYDIEGPCQKLYPDYDWGSLAVWAWGAMRVADYLLGESWVYAPDGIPHIDAEALIVTGHSRRGKTALLAGAIDERFKMVVPNGSGCGGAGSFLVQGYLCE